MRITTCATAVVALAAAIGFANTSKAQTIGWLTTNFASVNPVESYGGGTLATLGTGQYEVTFPGFGDSLNSDVQVSAVDFNTEGAPHYCTAGGWYSGNGTDVAVDVDCFDATGALVNGDFALFYEARTSAPASGFLGFAWANQPTAANYFPDANYAFNSTGGAIDIERLGVGSYLVAFDGASRDGNPLVTAYGGGAAHCEVPDWVKNGGYGVEVFVRCFNGVGQPADEYFDIAYAYGVSHGDGPSSGLGAYVWASNATSANYTPSRAFQYNTISPDLMKAGNNGFGIGYLTVPGKAGHVVQPYIGLVTAIGSNGEFCDQNHIDQDTLHPKSPAMSLVVQCYTASGQTQSDEFSGAIIAHPVG